MGFLLYFLYNQASCLQCLEYSDRAGKLAILSVSAFSWVAVVWMILNDKKVEKEWFSLSKEDIYSIIELEREK